jgi:hypothetical protein
MSARLKATQIHHMTLRGRLAELEAGWRSSRSRCLVLNSTKMIDKHVIRNGKADTAERSGAQHR